MSYLPDGLHDEDFEALAFNVMAVPKGVSILDHFPVLKQYKEFEPTYLDFPHDSLLKYIMLLYQRRTPLFRFEDIIRRKLEAALMAGLPFDEEGRPHPEVDEVMKGRIEVVNEMIVRLARIQGSTKFTALIMGTEAFYKKVTLMNSDIDMDGINKSAVDIEKVRGELWKQARQMESELSQMALELLNEDNNPYLKKDLFCIVDRESSQLMMPTPERIAKYGEEAYKV